MSFSCKEYIDGQDIPLDMFIICVLFNMLILLHVSCPICLLYCMYTTQYAHCTVCLLLDMLIVLYVCCLICSLYCMCAAGYAYCTVRMLRDMLIVCVLFDMLTVWYGLSCSGYGYCLICLHNTHYECDAGFNVMPKSAKS